MAQLFQKLEEAGFFKSFFSLIDHFFVHTERMKLMLSMANTRRMRNYLMLKQEIPAEHGKVSGNFDMKLK